MSISDLRTNKFASILTKTQIARFKYLGLEECKTSRQEAEDVLVECLYDLSTAPTQLRYFDSVSVVEA